MVRHRMGARVRLTSPITDSSYDDCTGWYEQEIVPAGEEGRITDSRGSEHVSYEVLLDRGATLWLSEDVLEAV